MTYISLSFGRPAGRIVLYGIAAYFFLFAPQARRHARRYLRRALEREPTATDRFRHILYFASTIHDRVYLSNDRFGIFAISLAGEDLMRGAREAGTGGFLMGAHLGSFEAPGAIGRQQRGLSVVMAMYEDNARKINESLAAINPARKPEIISLGTLDALLQIRARLDAGAFVGMLADRTLSHEQTLRLPFLGAPADFPVGPFRAAAMLRRRVYFMVGLYRGGNRYHVVFEELGDFSATAPEARDAAISAMMARYVATMERYCRSDPYNWFNFFDFWGDAAAGAGGIGVIR